MAAFDYLSVLISIVLGLGITQLLSGFGRCLERRNEVKLYAPAIAWALFLLLVHIQTWWTMFGLRHWPDWTFLQFAAVLLQPIVLFLLTTVALPGTASAELDLKINFFANRVWFFTLLLVLITASLAKDLARLGTLPGGANLVFHAALVAVFALGLITKGDRLHHALAFAGLLLLVSYVVLLFANLA